MIFTAKASPSSAIGLTAGAIVIYGAVYGLPALPPHHAGSAYIVVHLCASALMFAVWASGRADARAVLIAGLAARLLLLPAPELTSNDAERYLWDGAVSLAGFDPYTTPADSESVAFLRDVWPTPLEHEHYATLYPPVSLALFTLSAAAGPEAGPWVWKALSGLAGVGALLLTYGVLKRRGLLRHLPLVALSPLLILETGVGAHVDAFSVLAVAAAVAAFDRRSFALAGVVLGVSLAVKFLPVLLLGPLMIASRYASAAKMLAGAGVAVALVYGTSFAAGHTPIGVINVFFEKWRFGSPLFSALETVFSGYALFGIILAMAGAMLAGAAVLALRNQLAFAMAAALAAPLAVSPVVFPWYLTALVPVIALRPSAALLAWVSAAPLGYVVLNGWHGDGVWAPAAWPLWIIAASVALGLLIDMRMNMLKPAPQPVTG